MPSTLEAIEDLSSTCALYKKKFAKIEARQKSGFNLKSTIFADNLPTREQLGDIPPIPPYYPPLVSTETTINRRENSNLSTSSNLQGFYPTPLSLCGRNLTSSYL